MPINLPGLRGETAVLVPDDGVHTARLERTNIVELTAGLRLVTDWRALDSACQWSSWNWLEGDWPERLIETGDLLAGLGVEATDDEDELAGLLAIAEGGVYQVRTETTRAKDGRLYTRT